MLKHGRIGLMRPEQFPKPFNIYGQDTESSIRGRERLKAPALKASVRCILSVATPEEKMMYSQTGVAVSHKIIQRGAPIAKEQDVFVLAKGGKETRCFRVQAVHNKGELDVDTTYYCEERGDLQWDSTST